MIRLILHIIMLAVLAVFISLNLSYRTTVNLFGMVMENASVVVVVLLAIAGGILYSMLIYLVTSLMRMQARKQKARIDQARNKEKELLEREKLINQNLRQQDPAVGNNNITEFPSERQ